MTQIMRRGLFTDLLLEHLTTPLAATPVLLGDGEAPADGGWAGQQAGRGSFTPYVVLTTGSASPNFTEPLRGADSSWRLGYQLRGVGANRQQADFACDVMRPLFAGLKFSAPVGISNAPWKVLRVRYTALGDVRRNDATDPPLWECVDSLEIWLDLGQ